jgi:hypothetical protein
MTQASNMQTIITGQLESITRYQMEGGKGGSLWVSNPDSENPDILGKELIKVKMPYEMFEQQKAKKESGELKFPAQVEILCNVTVGGQNKMALVATSIRLIKPENKNSVNQVKG